MALVSGIHLGTYEIVTGSRIMLILVLITMQQLQSKIPSTSKRYCTRDAPKLWHVSLSGGLSLGPPLHIETHPNKSSDHRN